MAPSREAFRRRFEALSPAAATDFLAELFALEGWAVDRGDGRLTLSRDGSTLTVALAGETTDISEPDVVATRGGGATIPPAAERLDADDLYDRTRYAVGAAEGERLLAEHFPDLPEATPTPNPADDEPPAEGPEVAIGDDAGPPERAAPAPTWTRRALLLAGGAGLGAGLVGLAGLGSGGGRETPTPVEPTPTPTPASAAVAAPGLSSDGVDDAAAFADAHADATEARSYEFTFEEFRYDQHLELRSAISLDMSLSADHAYLAVVSTAGPDAPLVLGRPPARSVYWSNGEEYYVDHRPDGWAGVSSFRPLRGWVGTWRYWSHVFAYGGTAASGPEAYTRSVFDAVPTRLVARGDDPAAPRYRLEGRARSPDAALDPLAGTAHRDLDLTATVDGTGLLRRHDLSYTARFGEEPGQVRRTLRYDAVGETTVGRPVWAD